MYSVNVGTPHIGPGRSAGRHDPEDRAAPLDANANSTENRRPIRQMPDSLRNLPTVLRPDTRNTLHFNRITKAAYATDNPAAHPGSRGQPRIFDLRRIRRGQASRKRALRVSGEVVERLTGCRAARRCAMERICS